MIATVCSKFTGGFWFLAGFALNILYIYSIKKSTQYSVKICLKCFYTNSICRIVYYWLLCYSLEGRATHPNTYA